MPSPSPSFHQTFLSLLPHCKSLPQLQSLHASAVVSGLGDTLKTSFLSSLTHLPPPLPTSSLPYALSLFRQIPSPSTFPHNLIIRIHNLLSRPLPGLRFFLRLRRLSLPPDTHTFPFALKSCSLLPPSPSSLLLARSLHSQSLKFGHAADPFVANTLISVYTALASVADAHRVFTTSPSKDVVSYNTILDGYVKSGSIDSARELFERMPERDAVSWGTLLAGCTKFGRHDEALALFDRMLDGGIPPDDVALVSVLSSSAQLGALDRGKAVHDYVRKNRVGTNVYLSTGLVDMYAKCGCMDLAAETFEASPRPSKNVFTWNAIVLGAAMHGHGELALHYFERMTRGGGGVRPDGVTLLGVLVGCSHAGLTDVARSVFDGMERVYGVERELKHYGCMADLLGRAGLIEEAVEMVRGMPMEADAYVWGGILGGCRIHGNVEVAEIAAKHLLEIDPEDSGIYSVMAAIYAAARRWEDVARTRRLMNDRKVKKNVGCSFIEVRQPYFAEHIDKSDQYINCHIN